VIGSTPSWLPHTETQGNSINTDINVDGLHQKRLNAILYNNPFGDQFSLHFDDWTDLYKLVCNMSILKRRRNTLSEIHKLSIAVQLRGVGSSWTYKFRPQHVIHDDLCMVLQKRAFQLENSGHAKPIPLHTYDPRKTTHCLVREIAFGPDSDSTVRGVALWFNIPEPDVALCTPQQAKRFRWKKSPRTDVNTSNNQYSSNNKNNKSNNNTPTKPSIFDSRECFAMIRPPGKDAYDLTTKILEHRLATVTAERLSSLSERSNSLKALQVEKELLTQEFRNQRRHWVSWAWPMNAGRQAVDEDTPVPAVDGNYTPIIDQQQQQHDDDDDNKSDHDQDDNNNNNNNNKETRPVVMGKEVQAIWDSFVTTKFTESNRAKPAPQSKPERPAASVYQQQQQQQPLTPTRRRLAIFERLAHGEAVSEDRRLPHVIFDRLVLSQVDDPQLRQSERCWKSLMLPVGHEQLHELNNEWEVVREHFQNARCMKVLNIIQQ
jgi:hypothetical protein